MIRAPVSKHVLALCITIFMIASAAEAAYQMDPCVRVHDVVVRDFFSQVGATTKLRDAFNAGANNTGLFAITAPLDVDILRDASEGAYACDRGAYDVAHFIDAPFCQEDKKYLTNVTDIWVEADLFTKMPDFVHPMARNQEGAMVGIPYAMDVFGLVYNSALFDTWGVSLPKAHGFDSLTELASFCQDLRDAHHIAADAPCIRTPKVLGRLDTVMLLDMWNVRLHGQAFHEALLAGEVAFNDPRFIETLATIRDAIDQRVVFAATSPEEGFLKFVAGESPFVFGGGIIQDKLSFYGFSSLRPHMRMIALPPIRAPTSVLEFGFSAFVVLAGIPVNTINQDAARAYINFTMSEQGQAAFFPFASQLPIGSYTASDPMRVSQIAMIERSTSPRPIFPILSFGIQNKNLVLGVVVGTEAWLQQGNVTAGDHAAELEALRQAELFSQAIPPTADPPGGDFLDRVEVVLSTVTPGARVHYTTDGSIPFDGSPEYTPGSPVVLSVAGDYLLRAVAVADDLKKSSIFQTQYTITVERSSVSGLSSTQLAMIIAAPVAFVVCVVIPIAVVLWRKIRAKRVSYSIGGDAPILVDIEQVQFVRPIGMGSFGEVFLGRWRGSDVAVKTLTAAVLDPETVETFLRETSLTMHLRHRNIVTFMGVCTEPLCIISEYMNRGSLYDVLHSDAIILHPDTVRHWAGEIASGMAFLHSAHPPVLHRDFKSLNVLLDRNWVPKIADFGLSTMRDTFAGDDGGSENHGQAAPDDETQGTMYWTAPEVLHDASAFLPQSDVYAYGITLWEMCTRQDLYAGELNQFAVALAVLRDGKRPDPTAVGSDYHDLLVPLMQRCWAQDPEDRPLFPEIAAEIHEKAVDADHVPIPETKSEPAGSVVVVSLLFPQIEQGMSECPKSYASALSQAHAVFQGCAERAHAYVWRRNPRQIDVAFHSIAQFGRFADNFSAEYAKIRWNPRLLVDCGTALPCLDTAHQVTHGVRWTAAVAMGEPEVTRNAATCEAEYRGPCVDAARTRAASAAIFNAFAIEPMALRALEHDHTLAELYVAPVGSANTHGDAWAVLASTRADAATDDSDSDEVGDAVTLRSRQIRDEEVPSPWLMTDDQATEIWATAERYRIGSYCECNLGYWDGQKALFKRLLRQKMSIDEQIAFLSQIASIRLLDHPSLLPILAASVTDGHMMYVVPFAPHGSLADVLGIHDGPLARAVSSAASVSSGGSGGRRSKGRGKGKGGRSKNRMLGSSSARTTLARQIASGLAHLHDHAFVFDGLKPNNVLIGAEGQALLSDYGFSGQRTLNSMTATCAATYEAPECLSGCPHTPQTDVFSLGTVFYELLGQEAFPRGRNALETAMKMLAGNMPDPPSSIPRAQQKLIRECWHPDPSARPDAVDIVARL